MMNDSKARYGSITRFFHWSMAILVSWQFLKFFDRINQEVELADETVLPLGGHYKRQLMFDIGL